MKIQDVCRVELQDRINQVDITLRSARQCLADDDFLQCAVRLQMLSEQGEFSELLMKIFDSVPKS